MTRFAYTVLYVQDVPATLRFWTDAFGLEAGYVHPGQQYAELNTGPTTLAFACDEISITALHDLPGAYAPNRPDRPPPGMDVALAVDDVQAAWTRAVDSGSIVVSRPIRKPWGQLVGYVRERNGILVEIAEPIDRTRESTTACRTAGG